MTINEELKNNLLTEFNRNDEINLLKEVHGYISNINEIVDYFSYIVRKQIRETIRLKSKITKTYRKEITIETFFKSFNLTVTFEYNKEKRNHYLGGLHTNSIVKNRNGEWKCIPIIELIIYGVDYYNFDSVFRFLIAHELTHAYDYLQYAKETNENPLYSLIRNNYANLAQNKMNPKNETIFSMANVLYHLNKTERNAYIAQIKQELLNRKTELTDWQTILKLIKTTESYKKFLYLQEQISIFAYDIKDEKTQNELIGYLNNLMQLNFTTYNQLKKYFLTRWLKWKNAYLSKITKIAYDCYIENKGMWIN